MHNNISLIGGDNRNIELAKLLIKDCCNVKVYGLEDVELKKYTYDKLENAVEDSEIIVLGIPVMQDNDLIKASVPTSLTHLLTCINENQKVYGGVIKDKLLSGLQKKNIEYFDFMKSEEFAIMNTIPTVEGAIEFAIRETNITLHDANVLVLGFGRIGKLLSKILKDLGSKVEVTARKQEDFAWIDTYGYAKVKYSELDERLEKYDIIFNTIPTMILDKERLENVNKESLIIDLAAKPGGVDFDVANDIGIKTNWALALPGKVAPKSAAKYMKNILLK